MTSGHGAEPRIRVYDVMAQGASDTGLEIATGRQIDLPVTELARLLAILGDDGLQAFCLYLEHLEHVPGVDGSLTLGVPHFSARWLLSASIEAAELTGLPPLSKNAATRGHQAVERSGLLHALPNPPAVAGQGARGRTFRAVLNPRLVIIRGGRDDVDDLPRVRRGRPRKDQPSPVSQEQGNRGAGTSIPASGASRSPRSGPLSPSPRNRGLREDGDVSPLVSAVFAGTAAAVTTSAVGVVEELLSSDTGPGLLAASVVPALRRDRRWVTTRLRTLFNDVTVAERAAEVIASLGLPGEETRRADVLADLIADTLLNSRDTPDDLRRLGVTGVPPLTAALLRERLVVGLLIGWGLRRVASWGAWLHQATRPEWTPKPGPLLNQFLDLARALPSLPAAPAAASGRVEPAPPPPTAASPVPGAEAELLPEATVDLHFAAARRKWPMFCRDGTPQAADPVWRSRLVRMYLTSADRQAELETTAQVMSR